MALPANITAGSDSNVLTIAASNNKGLLIRFLNEQVEDGFYALVIDYLKDSNFDLKNMMVDDDVKAQCTKLYELGEFVDTNIKATGRYDIDEWIEPLFKFVYGDIDPQDIDAPISTSGIYLADLSVSERVFLRCTASDRRAYRTASDQSQLPDPGRR